jgi:hypothetical protein
MISLLTALFHNPTYCYGFLAICAYGSLCVSTLFTFFA